MQLVSTSFSAPHYLICYPAYPPRDTAAALWFEHMEEDQESMQAFLTALFKEVAANLREIAQG